MSAILITLWIVAAIFVCGMVLFWVLAFLAASVGILCVASVQLVLALLTRRRA